MKSSDSRVTRRAVLAGAAQAAFAGAVLSRCQAAGSADESTADGPSQGRSPYVIWDAHGHLDAPGSTPGERITNLLKFADRMSIERVIVFMGYPWTYDPDPADMRHQNDQVMQAVEHSGGRALGFAYLNPKHTRESLDEL